MIGSVHPGLQGHDPFDFVGEIWGHFDDIMLQQRTTGAAVIERNTFVLLNRGNMLEETYFSYKFNPVIGPEGSIVGSHATVTESTHQVISERRLKTVHSLGVALSECQSIKDLCMQPSFILG